MQGIIKLTQSLTHLKCFVYRIQRRDLLLTKFLSSPSSLVLDSEYHGGKITSVFHKERLFRGQKSVSTLLKRKNTLLCEIFMWLFLLQQTIPVCSSRSVQNYGTTQYSIKWPYLAGSWKTVWLCSIQQSGDPSMYEILFFLLFSICCWGSLY